MPIFKRCSTGTWHQMCSLIAKSQVSTQSSICNFVKIQLFRNAIRPALAFKSLMARFLQDGFCLQTVCVSGRKLSGMIERWWHTAHGNLLDNFHWPAGKDSNLVLSSTHGRARAPNVCRSKCAQHDGGCGGRLPRSFIAEGHICKG